MELLHKGFDGLDISYPLTLPEELAEKMREAKEWTASGEGRQGLFIHGDIHMTVEATGLKGGYAYRYIVYRQRTYRSRCARATLA